MRHSRRTVLSTGLASRGSGMLRAWPARAAELRFADDPFALGVASGYPEPNAAVLWTRLAPEPLVPGGGIPAEPIAVDWEVGADEQFRSRRSPRHGPRDTGLGALGSRRGRGFGPRARLLVSLHERRRAQPGRPHAHGRPRAARCRIASRSESRRASTSSRATTRPIARWPRTLSTSSSTSAITSTKAAARASPVRTTRAECHTLEDYRQRYAIYKSDPHLQAAHAAGPWMLVSDDHEVANDYAAEHSGQDDPPELFLARRAAAYQAYYEHLPLPRRLVPFDGRQRLYTSRSFGDLATVLMLDGRQYRSRQACAPGPLVEPCAELYANERSMLGDVQEAWLRRTLGASTARWNLLGQQTLLAHLDQSGDGPRAYWADGWNGYPAARERLVEALLARPASNPVVFSGDIHAFLVNDVHAVAMDYDSPVVATELVTSSISSLGRAQDTFDRWRAENPNVRFARSDYRGYVRVDVAPEQLHAELVAVDDVARADSATHVLASFDVESGKPGVVR